MKSDRLCVVTGSSAGIGKAVAELLLERGWAVLGIARREAALHDPHYAHVRLDLTDLAAVEQYFTQDFARDFPAHDLRRLGLVNNAALLEPIAPVAKLPLAELSRAMTVNATVPIWLMGFFLRHCGRTPLRIVNLSSGAAHNARGGWAAYGSSKAALLMAGRVFQDEAAQAVVGVPHDVAVLSYEPGLVNTHMQDTIRGTRPEDFPAVERFVKSHREGKLADPARPARDIADFLARDGAAAFSEGKIGA